MDIKKYQEAYSKLLLSYPNALEDYFRVDGSIKGNAPLEVKSLWFLLRAEIVHGSRYDYGNIHYIDSSTKIEITCTEHGNFWQNPTQHLTHRAGCPSCTFKKVVDTDTFLVKAGEVHGSTYNYSKVVYCKTDLPVTIVCPTHGDFQQTPHDHLAGSNCPKCVNRMYKYLYFIRCGLDLKIGITNNPSNRLAFFSRIYQCTWEVEGLFALGNSRPVEKELHFMLQPYRKYKGFTPGQLEGYTEMFRIPAKDSKALIAYVVSKYGEPNEVIDG